jgi:Tol biopolymer transport system component
MRTRLHAIAIALTCAVALGASDGFASSPVPSVPMPSVVAPLVVLDGHAGDGVGVYLSSTEGPDRTWIFTDIPSTTVDRPDWSPDGRRIAVEVTGDGDAPPMSIWVGDADGHGARQVATCAALPCLQLAMPAWSPDGTSLALVRYDIEADGRTWGKSAIEILDLASGQRRTVVQTADATTSFANPRWAPDGKSLVLEVQTYADAATGEMTASGIATVDVSGPPSQTPPPVTPSDGFGSHPDWSPDGTRILFGTYGIEWFETGGPGASNLYTVSPDGSDLRQLTTYPVGGTRAGHASWTPDGSQVIFTKIEGHDYDGYGARYVTFMDADGSNLSSIDGYLGTYPRLQPVP